MACPEMQVETDFLKVLESADNYAIAEDRLSLHMARMAPLARFERSWATLAELAQFSKLVV